MSRLKPVVDIVNRLSAWLLLLAIGWLCWTAARLLWLLLAPPIAPALPIAALQNIPSSVADNSSLFAIFSEPNSAAVAAQPPPNVVLKGVLLAIPERLSSALLEVNGEVKNYRIGESLQDSGYTLVAVDWNAVVIADKASKQSVISMADAMPLDQRGLAANAIGNRRSSNTLNNDSIDSAWPQPTDIANANNAANNTDNNANSNNPTSAIGGAISELQQNPANYLSSGWCFKKYADIK